jgi:hypothetical protein
MLYSTAGSKGADSKMEKIQTEKRCELVGAVRDHSGRVRFGEKPTILRVINNLDRRMFLVKFDDGATTFLFPSEVILN